MKENKIRILSGKDLKKLLTMTDCIDAMKSAFAAVSNGEVEVPLRTGIDMKQDNGGSLFMPVYSSSISRIGVKTVMLNKDNPDKGLPFIHAMVTLFDSGSGAPIAIMDGEVITAMRTGAVSGLATALLARDDAKTAAIFGTGPQAETQLEAVCCARNIDRAFVFARNKERILSYADKMSQKLNIEVLAAKSPAALLEADIVCTATSSNTPVFDDSNIKKGTHINGVGSFRPDMAEVPPQTVLRSKVIVDQMQGCLAEAGDLTGPMQQGLFTADHIHGQLGDVVIGRICARETKDEITFFKSVGIAIQDLVTADLALKSSVETGIGQQITL